MTDLAPPPAPAPAPEPEIVVARLPYHRLYRAQPTYRWWRPLVAILLAAVFFLGVSILVAIPVFVVLFATNAIDFLSPNAQDEVTSYLLPDMARPWTLIFGLGSIILVLPLVPLALRIAGIRPTGVRVSILHSVLFSLRWRWLAVATLPALLVWVLTTGVQLALGIAAGEQLGEFTTPLGTYLLSVLIVVLLVPVQAATEEYLYRGILLQSFGAWVRFAPVPIVASAVLFGVSHAYDGWGILQVTIMGVGFAIATVRTGGLEAAIALHAVNNIGVFALTGTGVFGETGMTQDTGGPVAVIGQLVTVVLWLGALELVARRAKVERLSRIGVPVLPGMPGPPTR